MTPLELAETAKTARGELKTLDDCLAGESWLVGGRASAADVAVYPFLATLQRAMTRAESPARELGLYPLDGVYSNVARWMGLVATLPGYERTYPPHWRASK